MRYRKVLNASLVVLAGSSLSGAGAIAAEGERSGGASDRSDVRLDRVVVTGTSRADITSLEGFAPVDVLSSEDLERTGAADLQRALIALSPSFSFPAAPGGSFASSIPSGASLRGLSADQVLVLVNGKRRHVGANFTRQSLSGGRGSATVDLSLIPVSAVDHVEILRDGAAAQYGSDAIAGVVNIVLKGQKDGGGIGYRYGQYDRGDGQQHTVSGWKGFELPNNGFLTLSFDAGQKDFASDTNPDNRRYYPAGDPREQTTPYRNWRFGTPKVKDQFNLVTNAELPLTSDVTLYGFSTFGQRRSIGENFYEPPSTNSLLNQSVYYKQRYPDGRIPTTLYTLEDAALTGGARFGNTDTGKFDLSFNYGQNRVKSSDTNGINPSYGPDSPSSYATGTRKSSQSNAALDYVRDIPVSFLASPLTLSAGLAYRHEQYQLTAGDAIAYSRGPFFDPSTTIGVGVPAIYSGITGEDARTVSRGVVGGYVGVEGNVTEKLNVGLALRSERYSDFGQTTNGKASVRYDFTPQFALRSTVSNGYRAPSIVQLGYSAFSVQTANLGGGSYADVQQRTLLADSAAAALLGGKPLQPEKSKNFSIGSVWRPLPNASVTLDLYQIDIDNRILLSENLTGAAVTQAFAGTPYAGISNAAFFNNLLDTRTRGLELAGKYRLALGTLGNVDLSGGFALNRTKIVRARDVTTANGTVIPSTTIIGRNTRGLVEEITPKNKLTLGADWKVGQWDIYGAGRRYGKWTNRDSTTPSADQTFSPQWVFDLDVTYNFTGAYKGVKLTVGAVNLFDSHPDKTTGTGVGGVTKYSFNSPEGGLGAFYYTNLRYVF